MEPHENCKIKFQNNITLERWCASSKPEKKKRDRVGGEGWIYQDYITYRIRWLSAGLSRKSKKSCDM